MVCASYLLSIHKTPVLLHRGFVLTAVDSAVALIVSVVWRQFKSFEVAGLAERAELAGLAKLAELAKQLR